MSERQLLMQVDCDGCGYAGLEFVAEYRDGVYAECGWVHDEVGGWDWCPKCREDSPFAAVERVRAVCDRELIDAPLKMMSPVRLGYRDALRNIIRALEGDSDELASP